MLEIMNFTLLSDGYFCASIYSWALFLGAIYLPKSHLILLHLIFKFFVFFFFFFLGETRRKGRWNHSAVSDSLRPVDCRSPGSSVRGISQARILEWVAVSFSRGSSWPRDQTRFSHIAGRCFNLWATREVQSRAQFRAKNTWYST